MFSTSICTTYKLIACDQQWVPDISFDSWEEKQFPTVHLLRKIKHLCHGNVCYEFINIKTDRIEWIIALSEHYLRIYCIVLDIVEKKFAFSGILELELSEQPRNKPKIHYFVGITIFLPTMFACWHTSLQVKTHNQND